MPCHMSPTYRQCSSKASTPKVILGGALSTGLTRGRRRLVGAWLLGCAGMTWGAVSIGGLTRLTESGLSMVDWHLIKGMRPPSTEQEWMAEFEKYQQFPEFHAKSSSSDMTLSQFKFIWSMEYGHRMWGRLIGVAFLVPASAMLALKWFDKPMKKRMAFCGVLLIGQGLLGWYMVKSGLNPSQNSDPNTPRVSQYRLAAHLTSAMVLYSVFLWTGLSHVLQPFDYSKVIGIGRVRGMAHGTKTVIFATAIVGAFVAGLDAGLTYNSWPMYADRWIPSDLWAKTPKIRNFTENPTMVQFMHRNLAYMSLIAVTATFIVGRKLPLNRRTKMVLHALLASVYMQAGLGISTLLMYVPTWLASLHQNGSMTVLTLAFWLTNELRRIPK